ncbi:amidase [Bogoriella caseilytica]|uniref:Amidase n=1 Tax=Bogoriella caseilytica TaxID=56055 RepID=A0A3N2BDQ1_9MICO|nr:amidase family protein [Bogoriella caseilytica]ROR73379.1 amidase [Bogoriella caseilytica]
MSDELTGRTAADLAALLRGGAVSAAEAMDAHLRRIEAVNPAVNAVVDLQAERAIAGARAADEHRSAGGRLGPLHGLPVAHKDLIPARGFRFTQGSTLHAERVAEVDHVVVERMQAAGAISVGKTNVPEFGLGSHSFNAVYGVTRNPWDLSRTAGGSSGGAGAALAARMLPLADGSDTGGSLRNPASFCGVTALRPSPGTVPSWPDAHPFGRLSVKGPMGRDVADVALLLSVLTGGDPRAPLSVGLPGAVPSTAGVPGLPAIPGLTPENGEAPDPSPGRPLRVAWTPDLAGLATVASEVTEALIPVVERAADALGWEIAIDCPDLRPALESFRVQRALQMEATLGPLEREHPGLLKDDAVWNLEQGRRLTGSDVAAMLRAQAGIQERMREFFGRYDLLLSPACQVAPFPVEERYPRAIDGAEMANYLDWMTLPAAITGTACPAMSLPAAFTAGTRLPVGLQVVGPFRQERQLLGHAWQLEQVLREGDPSLGWAPQIPEGTICDPFPEIH